METIGEKCENNKNMVKKCPQTPPPQPHKHNNNELSTLFSNKEIPFLFYTNVRFLIIKVILL